MRNIFEEICAFKSFSVRITVLLIIPVLAAGCYSEKDYSSFAGVWKGYDSHDGKLKFLFRRNGTFTATRAINGTDKATIYGSYTLSGNRISIEELNGATYSAVLAENKIQGTYTSLMGNLYYEQVVKFELTKENEAKSE